MFTSRGFSAGVCQATCNYFMQTLEGGVLGACKGYICICWDKLHAVCTGTTFLPHYCLGEHVVQCNIYPPGEGSLLLLFQRCAQLFYPGI